MATAGFLAAVRILAWSDRRVQVYIWLMMDGRAEGSARQLTEGPEMTAELQRALTYLLLQQRRSSLANTDCMFPVCMKSNYCCTCTLRKHMVKIQLPHTHFLCHFYSASSKLKGDEMKLTLNTICIHIVYTYRFIQLHLQSKR